MSIWKRILLFLAVFLLVLSAVCFPFWGQIPSWIATLGNSWNDQPYQVAASGPGSTLCAARVEKDGDLSLRFFDPSAKRSLEKWDAPLPEAAAQGEICMLYPLGNESAFLGVYEEDAQYLSLYQIQKDGTVERLCRKFREKGIPYGFGGIASPGKGDLPAEYIIREHYRLGSGCVILSRSFCNTAKVIDTDTIRDTFNRGVAEIRAVEQACREESEDFFSDNRRELCRRVQMISERIAAAK